MTDFGRRIALHSATHEDAGTDEVEATDLEGRINYVDRGDPSSWDFSLGDLTTDGTWNELDLSSIVPVGSLLIHCLCSIKDNATNSFIQFREKGNTGTVNASSIRTQVGGVIHEFNFFVIPDEDRIIEYRTTNTTFDTIVLVVCGWFI